MLIGTMLQRAGLKFLSATGTHAAGGVRIDEVVCATPEDAAPVDEWAAREGRPVKARVASAAELREYEETVY